MKVHKLFNQCATEYDQDRRKLVPHFDDFYGAVFQAIPFSSEAPLRILDLGAGTGLLAAMAAQAFPNAHLHLTDFSPAMLAKAEQRFAGRPSVSFGLQEHGQFNAREEYDLVLSALSIHHLDDAAKRALFGKVFSALRPNGMFLNADQARAPSLQGEMGYQRQWLHDVRANEISDESLRQAQERMAEDRNALLSEQLQWLGEAGFIDVDCWYKRFRFVVYGGVKGRVSA